MTMCRLLACVFGMLVFGSFFFNTQSLFVEWSALFCAIGCDSSMVRQRWKRTLPKCRARYQVTQHSFTLGTSEHHSPQNEAIPAANQWTPRENIPAIVLGLVTMMSVYLKVLNIDWNTWISAIYWMVMQLARRLRMKLPPGNFLVGTYRAWSETLGRTTLMSMTRVQDE